jgi:ParB-like chromosome segregation protein Spo0J
MTIIDGAHRILAARLKGCEEIDALFFFGSHDDAFRLAVAANVTHGLPLTLADRRAAALRIMTADPELSDRSIAATVGLAAKTVATIRRDAGAISSTRMGRDGRRRPINAAEGRSRASAVITTRPNSSLREIASEAGVSLSTARDVRVQMLPDPASAQARPGAGGSDAASSAPRAQSRVHHLADRRDPVSLIQGLRRDPSVRYTDSGRELLRWLGLRVVTREQWRTATAEVPPHCAMSVARIARECARVWADLAEQLEQTHGETV